MKKKWSDYFWIASLLYLFLGLFHILFAWLGLICFLVPLLLAVGKGEKSYCNHYCGRGQLMQRLGNRFSAQRACPGWLRSRWFRYGFLLFFLSMFASMLYMSYAVLQGKPLSASITLLWTCLLYTSFSFLLLARISSLFIGYSAFLAKYTW